MNRRLVGIQEQRDGSLVDDGKTLYTRLSTNEDGNENGNLETKCKSFNRKYERKEERMVDHVQMTGIAGEGKIRKRCVVGKMDEFAISSAVSQPVRMYKQLQPRFSSGSYRF